MSNGSEISQIAETIAGEAENSAKRSRVALVFTGGTMAVTTDKNAGPVPNLKGKEILERIPEVKKYLPAVSFEVFDFATLPGPHFSPQMMLTLSDFVRAVSEDCDGVVITHGTDSMEESAYFLDLALDLEKPVVFTGAMHHSLDAGWDGGTNLIDAIAVAASEDFRNEGVLVVMDGTIHHAAEVTKAHTMRTDTFRSPDFGPLGTVDTLSLGAPAKLRSTKFRIHIPLKEDEELSRVELFKTYSGMDDMLFTFALKEGVRGIVVEAMGQGNVPPGAVNGIARAREMQIPVVITSRCPSGPVRPYYAYPGAGRELQKAGCLFAPYLNGPKARLKLMLAIGAGYGEEQLKEIFPPG
jgi:L-asparaginase